MAERPRDQRARGLSILGHPVHPALSDFPMALLLGAVIADVVALAGGGAFWWALSFWLVLAGVASALPTAGAGLMDFVAIPEGEPAVRTATIHLSIMLVAVGCFGLDLLLRGGSAPPQDMVRMATVALDVAGAVGLTIGGWFGGELVFGHGVGVMSRTSIADKDRR